MTTFLSESYFNAAANDCDEFKKLICKSNSRTLLKRDSHNGIQHCRT